MPVYFPAFAVTFVFMTIKPPLATARAASCDGPVHLFVCLLVCLSPKCKNAVSIYNLYRKSYMGFL